LTEYQVQAIKIAEIYLKIAEIVLQYQKWQFSSKRVGSVINYSNLPTNISYKHVGIEVNGNENNIMGFHPKTKSVSNYSNLPTNILYSVNGNEIDIRGFHQSRINLE